MLKKPLMERMKRFRNRAHAGAGLARKLRRYKGAEKTIVVGLARGGVPVAAAISEKLNLPCNVFVSRKLGTPEDQRRALGAVTETGIVFLDEAVLSTEPWLARELRRYIEEEIRLREGDVARRCACYRGGETLPDFRDQTVITVDDGTFTGATFVAALQSLRKLGARYLIGGLPVAPERVVEQIRPLTDDLIVLLVPKEIDNLGDYYGDFADLSDEEIVSCLTARHKAMEEIAARKTAA
jgi:putative phosphoribosyl transferase